MKAWAVLLLVAASCVCHAQAQTLAAETKKNYSLFRAIAKCAGAEKALTSTKGAVTVLAPTNEAVTAFLKDMGLTGEQVLGNEALCDELLAYHVLPYKATSDMIKKPNSKAQTLLPTAYVTFNKGPNGVTVTDIQGNTAKVTKADVKVGDAIIHGIDKVLLSDKTFTSLSAALAFHKAHHAKLAAAIEKAGLTSVVADPKTPFKGTILAPTNAAFEAAPALTAAQLKDVLTYHVLPANVPLLAGIRKQKTFATAFKGHDVTFTYAEGTAKNQFGMTRKAAIVGVKDEAGAEAKVVKFNIFAGQGVIHGIDKVLVPKGLAATTEKAAATKDMKKPAGRKLLQGGGAAGATDLTFRQQSALFDTADAIDAAASGQESAGAAANVGESTANQVGIFDGY